MFQGESAFDLYCRLNIQNYNFSTFWIKRSANSKQIVSLCFIWLFSVLCAPPLPHFNNFLNVLNDEDLWDTNNISFDELHEDLKQFLIWLIFEFFMSIFACSRKPFRLFQQPNISFIKMPMPQLHHVHLLQIYKLDYKIRAGQEWWVLLYISLHCQDSRAKL